MNRSVGYALLFVVCMAPCAVQAGPAENDVMALQKSAEAGNIAAVRHLFGFYPDSDGAVTEDIDMILGNVTRRHPKLFLEELERSNAGHGRCTTVGNTIELTDQTDAQIKELRARRQSLLSVNGASLKKLRDDCIRELDDDIRILVNAKQEMDGAQ